MELLLALSVKVVVGLLVLGILIFVHELGHFLVAKYYRVGVLEFAIGFGKKVFEKRVGETRYSIGLVPLGGYVRMVGDDPYMVYGQPTSSKETADEEQLGGMQMQSIDVVDTPEVQAMMADESRWFLKKPFFPKFMIVFAGPAFNFAFAWLIAFSTYLYFGADEPVKAAILGSLSKEMPAAEAGLLPGDKVLSVNSLPVQTWKQFGQAMRDSGGEEVTLKIERTDKESQEKLIREVSLRAKLESDQQAEADLVLRGDSKRTYLIGALPATENKPVSLLKATGASFVYVGRLSYITLRSLYYLAGGQLSAKNLSGPIAIVQTAGQSASRGFKSLLHFMALLSVSLAVLNLLPIPVLDGGHLFFFIIEKLKGSPVDLERQQLAHQVGMILLLLLMVFAVGNDLFRFTGIS